MTTQSARATQTHAMMDLFAAFARQVMASPDDPAHDDDIEPTAIRLALWCLTDEAFPLSIAVVEEIHAERRRRMSAATREERRESTGAKKSPAERALGRMGEITHEQAVSCPSVAENGLDGDSGQYRGLGDRP